jgi:hypothetical protein
MDRQERGTDLGYRRPDDGALRGVVRGARGRGGAAHDGEPGLQEKVSGEFAPLYRRHLEGRKYPGDSLGVYPLTDAGLVRWAAADIDLGDEASAWKRRGRAGAVRGAPLRGGVEGQGAPRLGLLRGVGRRATPRGKLLQRASARRGDRVRNLPQAGRLDAASPYGNFLHLPYYGHPEAQGGRYIIGRDGRALVARHVPRPRGALAAAAVGDRDATSRASRRGSAWRAASTQGDRPACVQALLDGPVPEGQRNDALARLAAHLCTTEGDPQGEGVAQGRGARLGAGGARGGADDPQRQGVGALVRLHGKRAVPVMAAACTWEACPFHRSAERERAGRHSDRQGADAEDEPPAPLPPTFSGEKSRRGCSIWSRRTASCATTSITAPRSRTPRPWRTSPPRWCWWRPCWATASTRSRSAASTSARTSGSTSSPPAGPQVEHHGQGARLPAATAGRGRAAPVQHGQQGGLVRRVAAQPLAPAQGGRVRGAAGNHLDRKHMGGAQSFLTELFASDRVTDTTRTNGSVTILNPALSILSGCTPSSWSEFARREDFASGFLARYIFLPARRRPPPPGVSRAAPRRRGGAPAPPGVDDLAHRGDHVRRRDQ